jgi:hypothetical protein
MFRSGLGLATVTAAMLAAMACTNDASRDGATDATESASNAQPNETGAPQPGEDSGTVEGEDPLAEFQLDVVRAEAEALLGMNEDDLEPSQMLRIVRRGEERLAATMDLRPGRMNVELDDHAGAYVVTRVLVETPDGNVVVE